jgi:hypothetical protein
MMYSITKAEQELQSRREGLNLRWYPRYHLAARAGWMNDPMAWSGLTAGITPFISIIRIRPSGGRCTGAMRAAKI